MFDYSRIRSYYIVCGYTDMRKQIDGLIAIVQGQFGEMINEGCILLFCGKRVVVDLDRRTLASRLIRTADMYLGNVRDKLTEKLIRQRVIHADETVLHVLKERGKPETSESRMCQATDPML